MFLAGGGLYVKYGDAFYLKGLVSASLISLGRCDVTNFALFTNADKFIDWIENPTEEILVAPAKPTISKPIYSQQSSNSQGPPSYSRPQSAITKPSDAYSKPQNSYSGSQGPPSYSRPQAAIAKPNNSYEKPQNSYSNSQVPPAYSRPQTAITKPSESYSKPQNSYTKPQASYSKPSYGQQQQSYVEQKPSYNTPAPSYNVVPPNASQPQLEEVPATCGIMSSSKSLIQGGTQSGRKQFPWTVAILRRESATFVYFSTGTLISRKHIVTTGLSLAYLDEHTQKYIARDPSDFRMYFGISDMEETAVLGASFIDGASEVLLHPKIKHGYPRIANIAVLKLEESIHINAFVRPVCLPDEDFDYEEVEGRNAYAVGWGQDDTGADSQVKKIAAVRIRGKIDCAYFWKDYLHGDDVKKFFCAGGDGRVTACYRDQPLYLKHDGKWIIQGLISIALNIPDGRCDPDTPVLYEDVGHYYDWLKKIIS